MRGFGTWGAQSPRARDIPHPFVVGRTAGNARALPSYVTGTGVKADRRRNRSFPFRPPMAEATTLPSSPE